MTSFTEPGRAPARAGVAAILLLTLALGGCSALVAQNPASTLKPVNAVADGSDDRVMLKGYDVVAYFTQGRHMIGTPQIKTVFEGVTFAANTGFSPSAYATREGLAVDTSEIAMALSSEVLTEHDLAAGLWDEAGFRLWRVDWSDVGSRSLELTGTIGEVSRGPVGFKAELRSAMHRLNRPEGRVHTQLCDANLGDGRCGFALATAGFTVLASITALLTDRLGFTAAALNALPDHRFKGGKISFSTGANLGLSKECKDSLVSGGSATVLLAEAFAYPLEPGDQFTITAGCQFRHLAVRGRNQRHWQDVGGWQDRENLRLYPPALSRQRNPDAGPENPGGGRGSQDPGLSRHRLYRVRTHAVEALRQPHPAAVVRSVPHPRQ